MLHRAKFVEPNNVASWFIVFISFVAAEAEDNKNYDCFAIFILTHGSDSGKIYGTDGDIAISQLTVPLKNDLLVGKPKMVFVQVCCTFADKC